MSIVAVLQGALETDTATTRSAAAIAGHLHLPLKGLFALPDPQSALMLVSTPEAAGLSAATAANLIELEKEMLSAAEHAFRSVAGEGAAGAFVHQVASADRSAADAATLADALVFPRSAAKAGQPLSQAFEHVLMDARLPLVLAGSQPFVPGPVIIGWDGSNGASRAVRFHLPLISALGEVIIAQNEDDAARDGARPGMGPASLADWLAQKGVAVRTERLQGENVGAALLSLARDAGATLIVAGAYGHSRLGERLFGGTSRSLLEASEAPALALSR